MRRGQRDERRVVVTGLGCVSPLGADAEATWKAASQGVSAAGPIRRCDTRDLPVAIGAEAPAEIQVDVLTAKERRRLDRSTLLAVAAAEEALADGGLDAERIDRDRVGVAIGTAIGGITTILDTHDTLRAKGPRRVSPFFIPMGLGNMASGTIAMCHGLRGPNLSPVGACASGAQAIGEALRIVARGDADVMLAGGTDSTIHPLVLAGFAAMRALSTRNDEPERASRPFDRGRDGFVIAEGAAVLLIESVEHARARGARMRAELLGYGVAADAAHFAQPAEDGGGARLAMRRALADADLAPGDVDHLNAHATSTPAGDRVEAQAIRAVFGAATDRLPVSATKSMTGHLMGATGALELLLCVRALETGLLPPTINLDDADPDCALDHVANKARPHRARVALSNSFGFGGINASLVLGRGEDGWQTGS